MSKPSDDNHDREQTQDGSVGSAAGAESSPEYGPIERIVSPEGYRYGGLDLQMAEVCPGLFFGSQDVAYERDQMKSKGVTHIINAAPKIPNIPNVFPGDFTYKTVDPEDSGGDVRSLYESCMDFIDEAIKSGNTVYVHCCAGISRSATICLAFLMSRRGMELSGAVGHIRSIRPQARPNHGFVFRLQPPEREA